MFKKQFLGTTATRVFVGIILIHIFALVFRETAFELPLLLLIAASAGVLAYRSLEWGMVAAFAELFVGGHGHLLDADVFGFSLSLRMAIFLGVMAGWSIAVLRRKQTISFNMNRDIPWIVLTFAVLFGTATGFLHNPAGVVFDDMNGYLVMAYLLPVISLKKTAETKRMLLQTLFASSAWLVLFTLVLSFVFTHLDGKTLAHVYRFVRDARLAEITLQTVSNADGVVTNTHAASLLGADGYWYRIFMQSQFFLIAFASVLLSGMLLAWKKNKLPNTLMFMFVALGAGILLSMSRSFALGAVAAVGLMSIYALKQSGIVQTVKRLVIAGVLMLFGCVLAWGTVAFPFPPQPGIQDAAFYSTSAGTGRDAAVSSRWSLLGPMMDQIKRAPILGSGFGTEVTYTSDDPRVRSVYEDGVVTTYRFEWGYQDLWLKMGVLGLIAFVLIGLSLGRGTYVTAKEHGYSWIVVGLGAGVVALYVAHIFSPFLNHPIGIGYLVFVVPFIDWNVKKKSEKQNTESVIEKATMRLQMTPVVQDDVTA